MYSNKEVARVQVSRSTIINTVVLFSAVIVPDAACI